MPFFLPLNVGGNNEANVTKNVSPPAALPSKEILKVLFTFEAVCDGFNVAWNCCQECELGALTRFDADASVVFPSDATNDMVRVPENCDVVGNLKKKDAS